MDLSERIKLIIKENNLKQKEFAKNLGVTESYISALLNKRNTKLSQSLATLIQEKYGYNSEWILNGEEPKMKHLSENHSLSDIHKRAIHELENMTDDQAKAVLAFIKSLEELEKNN